MTPITGARGTEQLASEQKPRRKMRGRAQPYRRRKRTPGPTLTAMLKGAPLYLPNPADFRREIQKKRRR